MAVFSRKENLALACMRIAWLGLLLTMGGLGFAQTLVIDNESANATIGSSWWVVTEDAVVHGATSLETTSETSNTSVATFTATLETGGRWEVSLWYLGGSGYAPGVRWMVNDSSATHEGTVDQSVPSGRWVSLGTLDLAAGPVAVQVTNQAPVAGLRISADAVRLVREGTDYGKQYQGAWIFGWGSPSYVPGINSPEATSETLRLARAHNLNSLFVQVRKIADAAYISSIEPRATNIADGYEDPLADTLRQAHDPALGQRLEVHAWLVTFRAWLDREGAVPPDNVFALHPEWAMTDVNGSTSEGGTRSLDPGVPAVQEYVTSVVVDLVRNYPTLDGVHFDYFRYPGPTWGYNPTSLERFQRLYNRSDKPATNDAQWSEFRRRQIQDFARKVYVRAKQVRWNVKMTAALITWYPSNDDFTQTRPYYDVFQDWPAMMHEGTLDVACPMNYMREHVALQAGAYRGWCAFTGRTALESGRQAIMGPGSYLNTVANNVTQMLLARETPGMNGVMPYRDGYTSTGAEANETVSWRAIVADVFDQPRPIPDADWITSPTFGILCGTVRDGSSLPLDGVEVEVPGSGFGPQLTDGTGFYAFVKLPPGVNYVVQTRIDGKRVRRAFEIRAGEVTEVDLSPEFASTSDGWMVR